MTCFQNNLRFCVPNKKSGLTMCILLSFTQMIDHNTLCLKRPVGNLQGHGHVIYMQIGEENPFQQATF